MPKIDEFEFSALNSGNNFQSLWWCYLSQILCILVLLLFFIASVHMGTGGDIFRSKVRYLLLKKYTSTSLFKWVCLNDAKTNLKTILKLLNVLLTHLCDSTTLCTLLCRCLPTSFLCNWIVSGKYKWWLLSQLVTFIAQWLRILTGSLGCIHYIHEPFEKPTDCFWEVVGVPVKNSIEKAINSN